VVALVAALALPAVAFADKGGVPNRNARGASAAPDRSESGDDADGAQAAPARGKGKGADRDADRDRGPADDGAKAKGKSKQKGFSEAEESVDASGTPVVKRTGIENALERLQRNLARMQADLEAGRRSSLPPGLQRVIAKFMMWLGLTPGDGGDGGSEEPTSTVEPTGTVEPTETPEPLTP
jgi:hypothetical protein